MLHAVFVVLVWSVTLAAAAVILLRWAFPLPVNRRQASHALPMTAQTDVGRAVLGYMAENTATIPASCP